MEGSREEVMRFVLQVVAEFQIPDERTQAAKIQDWAVNLAWGGANELAASGMMNIMRCENGRQVDTKAYPSDRKGDGPGTRVQRKHRRDHENDQANLRHIDGLYARQRTPAPLSTHVSKHATSVARMNDGTAGGSARRHNDD